MSAPRSPHCTSQAGFTISEFVLVLVVVVGLITVAVVSISGLDDDRAARDCRSELRTLKAASQRFKAELGIYPPSFQALEDAHLLTPADTPNWRVVTVDEAAGPRYEPVGSRCA